MAQNSKKKSTKLVTKTTKSSTKKTGRTRDRLSAALLAIFGGVFGLHKFYLGQKGQGIAYITISILSFFYLSGFIALVSFIEAVRYLLRSDESFNAKYNIDSEPAKPARYNRYIYSIFAFSFGIVGLHKFYVRKANQGWRYFIFGLILPLLVGVPIIVIGFLMFAIGSEGAGGLEIFGGLTIAIGYLLTILSLTIVSVIVLIDGVKALFQSDEQFDQIYNL